MIRQSYDLDADALYIYVNEGARIASTAVVGESTIVDLDADRGVVGIEVIGLQQVWPIEEVLSRFPVSDEDAKHLRAYFPGGAIRAEMSI
jgi:uncharacterized protein YuzE